MYQSIMELIPLEELTQQIRNKRKRMIIEQQKLAELADMSPSQVNRIEKNTVNPSYKSLYQLWEILDSMEENNVETAEDVMSDPIIWIHTEDTLEEASKVMKENNLSQLPVDSSKKSDSPISSGRLTERRIMNAEDPDMKVQETMGARFPEVPESTKVDALRELLKEESAVIINDYYGDYVGIVTRADLI